MQTIENVTYILSKFFYIPVVVALFLLLVFTLYNLGVFIAEALKRLKKKDTYVSGPLQQMQAAKNVSKADAEILLETIIHAQQRKNINNIQKAKYCVKIGPTAGLIGTLTPMASALAGLAEGNMNSLAAQMITAFSTTVLGLVIGGIAYSIAHIRNRWLKADRYKLGLEAETIFKELK